jgi:hypothetical protein
MAGGGCFTRPEPKPKLVPAPHVEGHYQQPLVSPGAQFGALPPAVQNAVRAQAGTAVIDRVVKDRHPTGTVYKIYFRHSGVFPPLFVTPDGDVLNPDYTIAVPSAKAAEEAFAAGGTGEGGKVRLVDLPEEVLKIIQAQTPHGEIDGIEKQAWGDRSVYIVSFKGENASPKLYVRSDGIVLKEVAK